jgi:hypothetical protein
VSGEKPFTSRSREVLGVEKVGGANLIVSHGKVRVHRGRFDGHAHRRTGKVLVRHDCPAEGVEAPVYLAHDQVANYEADVGVSRVEFPRPGDEARDLGDAVGHRFSCFNRW